ncbi:hypothetical protein BU15DRAFT_62805 [Melanogaster broomeanus]|nr:hypothetical protein BU15DRAFT_62805 [Melanogaster broomeanus]
MLTIPDPLLMCVTHLETAREWFKYFEDLFDLKKSNTTQQEAKCNPRMPVDMRQKHREDARKPRKCKATVNKPKSTKAIEPRYISFTGSIEIHQETSMLEKEASQETKKKCEARDQGRVKKRVRRGRKAAERTSEQEAAVREPGEETTDEKTRSISLVVMLSSQDDNGRDMAAPCPTVKPQRPETMCQAANHAAADAVTPNVTSARPPLPAGASHELQDEPRKSMGSYLGSRGENNDSRGPGAHCMRITAQSTQTVTRTPFHIPSHMYAMGDGSPDRRVVTQTASSTASKAAADAANPNAMSARSTGPAGTPCKPQDEPQMEAGGVLVTAGQDIDKGVEREGEKGEWLNGKADKKVATVKEPGKGTTDPTTDGISLAAPASSPQVDEPIARRPSKDATDESTNDVSLAAPASSPDKSGGATSMSKTTDGTAKMDATATPPNMQGNAQKCTNGARASQQHDASANGEGHSTWTGWHGTAPQDDKDDEDVESRTSGRPLSMPLEGEHYAQRRTSSMHAGRTSDSGRVPNGIIEDPGGRMEPSI